MVQKSGYSNHLGFRAKTRRKWWDFNYQPQPVSRILSINSITALHNFSTQFIWLPNPNKNIYKACFIPFSRARNLIGSVNGRWPTITIRRVTKEYQKHTDHTLYTHRIHLWDIYLYEWFLVEYIPGNLSWTLFWLEFRPCFGGLGPFKNRGH